MTGARKLSALMTCVGLWLALPGNLLGQGSDTLFSKVTRNDLDGVKALLASGADINARAERYGHTPLIIACNYNHEDLAEYLVEQGADVNIRGTDGSTALIAASSSSPRLVRLLLSKGADARVKMENGTAAFTQCVNGIMFGQVSLDLAELLLSKGADVNDAATSGATKGYTPLIMAARNNKKELVEFLIQHGADVNATTGDGNTALSLATKAGHAEIVKMLKASGAK